MVHVDDVKEKNGLFKMDIDPTQLFNEFCLDSRLSDVELKQVCLHYHKYKGNESFKKNKTF